MTPHVLLVSGKGGKKQQPHNGEIEQHLDWMIKTDLIYAEHLFYDIVWLQIWYPG